MWLPMEIKLRLFVPESLNERLERGEPEAFKLVERQLTETLNIGLRVEKVKIENVGLHNVDEWDERS